LGREYERVGENTSGWERIRAGGREYERVGENTTALHGFGRLKE
jgi:hypothetical protein